MSLRPQHEAAAHLLASGQHVYLRPAVLAGASSAADSRGDAPLALAGGALTITGIEIITRGNRVAGGPVVAPATLRRLAARAGPDQDPSVVGTLDRLSSSRPPVAGLTFDAPRIMGVINVTPDSFSDGGQFAGPETAIAHGRALAASGADILDIGGESTRPGAASMAPGKEIARVLPVIAGLRGVRPLSIDTRNASVMAAALEAGATFINDVTALTHDPGSLAVAAGTAAPVVLMHSRGDPATMQSAPRYDDALLDVYDDLEARIAACGAAGIPPSCLIADPGIGFGKTAGHNKDILRCISLFHGLGVVLMAGLSRKSLIARLSAGEGVQDRLAGSIAGALWVLSQGVQIVRVHDVAETRQAISVWRELAHAGGASAAPADFPIKTFA